MPGVRLQPLSLFHCHHLINSVLYLVREADQVTFSFTERRLGYDDIR
jgi:hypothetical protein